VVGKSLVCQKRTNAATSCHGAPLWVYCVARRGIQAPKLEHRIMRYELTNQEWAAIKPMLPNKPRGVPRVNDRRVLNGIFWVLRSGPPWRDLPQAFGPCVMRDHLFRVWIPFGQDVRIGP
jgi:hypothetical protein